MRCEVCAKRLSPKTKGRVCALCRMAGAAFARDWMHGLRESGLTSPQIATVVGTTQHTVRARLSERRAA